MMMTADDWAAMTELRGPPKGEELALWQAAAARAAAPSGLGCVGPGLRRRGWGDANGSRADRAGEARARDSRRGRRSGMANEEKLMSDQTGPEADPVRRRLSRRHRHGAGVDRGQRRSAGPRSHCARHAKGRRHGGLGGGFSRLHRRGSPGRPRGRSGLARPRDSEGVAVTPSTPSPEAAPPPDWDEVLRRGRERERAARRDKLWREVSAFPCPHARSNEERCGLGAGGKGGWAHR